jgi:hypothetical protein
MCWKDCARSMPAVYGWKNDRKRTAVDVAVLTPWKEVWRWKFFFSPPFPLSLSLSRYINTVRRKIGAFPTSRQIFLWQTVHGDFPKLITGPSKYPPSSRFNLDLCVARGTHSHMLFCFFFTFKSTMSYEIIYFILSTYVALCKLTSFGIYFYSLRIRSTACWSRQYRLFYRYRMWRFCGK